MCWFSPLLYFRFLWHFNIVKPFMQTKDVRKYYKKWSIIVFSLHDYKHELCCCAHECVGHLARRRKIADITKDHNKYIMERLDG